MNRKDNRKAAASVTLTLTQCTYTLRKKERKEGQGSFNDLSYDDEDSLS